MKKILFLLVALMATLSLSAQTIKVYENGVLADTYNNTSENKVKAVVEEDASNNAQLVKVYQNEVLAKTYTNSATKTIRVVAEEKKTLLPGKFTVNASGKQVQFTTGNLWCNTNTNPVTWEFEEHQYDYAGGLGDDADQYNPNHVGFFFWTREAGNSYLSEYNEENGNTTEDVPFFAESTGGITVGRTAGYYALSSDEWSYLLNVYNDDDKNRQETNRFARARINGTNGMLLFPDGYNGVTEGDGIATVNDNDLEANFPTSNMADATWSGMEAAGVVFLPVTASYDSSEQKIDWEFMNGNYWTSTPVDYNSDFAYMLTFDYNSCSPQEASSRSNGSALRLVKTVKE